MEQNILWKTSKTQRDIVADLDDGIICSLIPTKQLEVVAKPIERQIVQPISQER